MEGIGGLEGWRWMFCIEGLFTIVWAVITYFSLPNNPSTVKFFIANETARCAESLRLDIDIQEIEKVKIGCALRLPGPSPHPPPAPLRLHRLHHLRPRLLLSLYRQGPGLRPHPHPADERPPYAWAFILTIITAYHSDKFMMRGIPILVTYTIALAGSIMFPRRPQLQCPLDGLFLLLGGVYANAPIIIAWVPSNCAGHTRQATSVAMTCIAVNLGGIISTWMFPMPDAPYYPMAAKLLLTMNIIAFTTVGLAMFVCNGANRKKEDPEYRRALLGIISDISYPQQLENLGDYHPDFKYVL